MSRTTAQILGAYRRELEAEGFHFEEVSALVSDAAHWLVREGGVGVAEESAADPCPGCGQDPAISQDPQTRGRWKAAAYRCFACDAIEGVKAATQTNHRPGALHYRVEHADAIAAAVAWQVGQ